MEDDDTLYLNRNPCKRQIEIDLESSAWCDTVMWRIITLHAVCCHSHVLKIIKSVQESFPFMYTLE